MRAQLRTFETLAVIAAIALGPTLASALPPPPASTGRLWLLLNGTAQLSPSWAFTVMPNVRYELARSGADSKGRYLDELFVGPTFLYRNGPFTGRLAAWYYFTGFRNAAADRYSLTHSLELVPTFELKRGAFSASSRTIFHNILYASLYPGAELRRGYSLVVRELVQLKYQVLPTLAVVVGDEPFWGAVSDSQAKPSAAGFWATGFRLNRAQGGVEYRPMPELAVTPQYVYETSYSDAGRVTERGHYLFLTVSYLWDLQARTGP